MKSLNSYSVEELSNLTMEEKIDLLIWIINNENPNQDYYSLDHLGRWEYDVKLTYLVSQTACNRNITNGEKSAIRRKLAKAGLEFGVSPYFQYQESDQPLYLYLHTNHGYVQMGTISDRTLGINNLIVRDPSPRVIEKWKECKKLNAVYVY